MDPSKFFPLRAETARVVQKKLDGRFERDVQNRLYWEVCVSKNIL